jgi:hypothetical protein
MRNEVLPNLTIPANLDKFDFRCFQKEMEQVIEGVFITDEYWYPV